MTTFDPPQPNLPLLRKCIDWAETEREKDEEGLWDQMAYAEVKPCGTSHCIAGFAVMNGTPGAQLGREHMWPGLRIDGEPGDWFSAGRDVLGLTTAEADLLFDSYNSFEMVRAIAEDIAERAGERL